MEATRENRPGDIEVGIADGAAPHIHRRPTARHAAPPAWLVKWEDRRSKLAMECFAEFLGTLIYCWLGQGSAATLIWSINTGQPTGGGIMNAGLAYTIGIMIALVISGPVSGGHLNPAFTLCFWFYKGFPLYKVPFYILSQTCGAFVGMLFVLGTFQQQLDALGDMLAESSSGAAAIYSGGGPAGVVTIFEQFKGQNNWYFVFCEFITFTFCVAFVFAVLDSSNIFVSASAAPFLIGIAFGTAIISFVQTNVCFNFARDIGARFACSVIYHQDWHKCWPGKTSPTSMFVNIPAAFFGAAIQTFLFSDSARPIIHYPPDPDGVSLRTITRPDYIPSDKSEKE